MMYSYSWTAGFGDNSKLKGEPDHSLFSQFEGTEVLYIINKLLDEKE